MHHSSCIAILGCGHMGRSLLGGLLKAGHPVQLLRAADPDPGQRERVQALIGVSPSEHNDAAIEGADVVILAVKPQAMKAVVGAAAPALERQRPLLISIAAGIPRAALRRWARPDLPMVRAMPNTPALLGAGASALCGNSGVSGVQKKLALAIMEAAGLAVWLEEEALLDVVTALSGTGPAYYFAVMEALEAAGTVLGLSPEIARRLTIQTALGSARMAIEQDAVPAELRRQVTSPGGTTERAMQVLEQGGFQRLLGEAVRAARQRSADIAATFGED